MGAFSFKSSGKTQEQQLVEAISKTVVPIGIKTPLQLGDQEGIFAMHTSLVDQVHDNLRNLLMTNWGEHLGIYDFGANLRPLVAEFATQDDFDAQAVERIGQAVSRWMPFVSLEDFLSEIDRTENKNTGVVRITVTYTVPALKTGKRALQVTLYVI
jgi:phage baseplate assembly protein W